MTTQTKVTDFFGTSKKRRVLGYDKIGKESNERSDIKKKVSFLSSPLNDGSELSLTITGSSNGRKTSVKRKNDNRNDNAIKKKCYDSNTKIAPKDDIRDYYASSASASSSSPSPSSPVKPQIPMVSLRAELLLNNAYEKMGIKTTESPSKMAIKSLTESLLASPLKDPIESETITKRRLQFSSSKPAYQKYAHLTQKSPLKSSLSSPTKSSASPMKAPVLAFSSPTKLVKPILCNETLQLPLPLKYKQLIEAFKSMDYAVSMMQKRHEMSTFEKVKVSVQIMMPRKTFDIHKLAQILTVFPEAYVLSYNDKFNFLHTNNESQLIIQLPMNCNFESILFLSERRRKFTDKLIEITKRYHREFLGSLNTPIHIDDSKLSKWHPSFNLDKTPEIVPNDNAIPKPINNERHKSVKGYLQNVTESTPKDSSVIVNDKLNDNIQKSPQKITNGPLKGISTVLLEKIRAKEAALLAKEITRKPEDERELSMIGRLPHFIRIIHSYYISEKRIAIPLEDIINKCVDSYHSAIAIIDVQNHIDLLLKVLPEWIWVLNVKRGAYVRIDKTKCIKDLCDILDKHANTIKKGE